MQRRLHGRRRNYERAHRSSYVHQRHSGPSGDHYSRVQPPTIIPPGGKLFGSAGDKCSINNKEQENNERDRQQHDCNPGSSQPAAEPMPQEKGRNKCSRSRDKETYWPTHIEISDPKPSEKVEKPGEPPALSAIGGRRCITHDSSCGQCRRVAKESVRYKCAGVKARVGSRCVWKPSKIGRGATEARAPYFSPVRVGAFQRAKA